MAYKCKADQAASARRHYERNKDKVKSRAKEFSKKYRKRLKATVSEIKAVPCADCGVAYPPCVMEFDHIAGIKQYDIGYMVSCGLPLQRVMDEIQKCEVVCANCHRLRTWSRRQASDSQTKRVASESDRQKTLWN